MEQPYYNSNGYWMPSFPGCTCEFCGIVYTAHRKGQKFCSKKCTGLHRSANSSKEKHTERTCPGCGKLWTAPQSNPSRYCSKPCIFNSGKWTKPRKAECEMCGNTFEARYRRSTGQWVKFCSHQCAGKSLEIEKVSKVCVSCGKTFEIYPKRNDVTCSMECRSAYFIRDRSAQWTGGLIDQGQRPFRRIDRQGYEAKYEGEHRLIAAREIGRILERGEVVLCLDKNHENINPENLFLCPSYREYGLINSSVVEWPQESNLARFRDIGYVRPNVILFLHDWETPRHASNGRLFTRHPQADEIVKRRLAGASVRQLASAFGMSNSGMANVVRNRL